MEGKVGGILIGVIIAVGVVWFRYSNKDTRDQDLRDTAYALFETVTDPARDARVLGDWFERHHETCFDANYRMGGRRTSTEFDETGYWNDLFDAMNAEAARANRTDLTEDLRRLRLRARG
jgi:hypothetical protein